MVLMKRWAWERVNLFLCQVIYHIQPWPHSIIIPYSSGAEQFVFIPTFGLEGAVKTVLAAA
jgi:hypothetical protein